MRGKNRILSLLLLTLILVACGTSRTVPITGRRQNLMVSDEQVLSLSNQEYTKYMQSATKSSDAQNTAMVKRVGERLAAAVEAYLRANGMEEDIKSYSWTFNLVTDKSVNAFCMPGGKIVVYEGLLPVTKDEASLAVVLGHEIAHAVARHSAERLSNAYKQQYGTQVLGTLASAAGVSTGVQQIGNLVASLGGQVLTAGFSRKQESEADHIGLIFAAMAGYDPQVAVPFWQRMANATGGGSNSIMSDHPSDATRIKNIQSWMPEALRYYKGTGTASSAVEVMPAKKFYPNVKKTNR